MTGPCRHCGDADADETTGLCPPCDRDDALAQPRAWDPLGVRFVYEEDVCGRPLVGVGAESGRSR